MKGFPTVHIVFSNKQPDKIPEFWDMTGYKTLFSIITDEQSKVVYRHLDTNVSKIDIQDKLDKLVETINDYILHLFKFTTK